MKKEFDEALKWYNKSLEIIEKIPNANEVSLADGYYSVGYIYTDKKKYNEALMYLNKALPIYNKYFGENNEEVVETKELIEQCKQALNE
jgi:tetratricopeptide (TPR) repeat protein